ncbi:ParB/RepB/Spo0J family partition protein [Pseudoponticoccus marisrubri]|uniref:ParB-like N-terminal domain-containing protein n=1 Tax=Pseudoponticoccus marisrubri TaxID=1685382 RepID=A0A0W7WHJ8_9RHOB|nr:ParB N-terminal domain-containing protein [Pseudoponticoccus marisrubri]KUF10022.1 hypothetical protein AVJ23_14865 [Pseudoponticoccus marisrubri]
MSRKRRMFEIEFEADPVEPESKDPPAPGRRGPMAAAITENAEALAGRQQAEAAIRAENDRLAHEYVALKQAGLIMRTVPLDLVDATKLSRDRSATRDPEMEELKASIRRIGLSNPIRVEAAGDRFELIQGYRRLMAFAELHAETGEDRFAEIPAHVQTPGDELDHLYRKMVDENLIRRDISFAEMATLALNYARDPDTPELTPFEAADLLFASAGRQKRSYIRHFTTFVSEIGVMMSHADAVPRKLGLDMVKRIEEQPGLAERIRDDLRMLLEKTVENELAILQKWLAPERAAAKPKKPATSSARTVMKLSRPGGDVAKCTLADGRLELRMDRDFSSLDRHVLEEAVQALLDRLEQ